MGSSNLQNADEIFSNFFGSNPRPFERSSSNHRNANDVFSEFFGSNPTSPSERISPITDSGFRQVFGNNEDSKAAALEYKLSCSLEELYSGSTRKIKISRNVLHPTNIGRVVQESEIIEVQVKRGWKKGTKITFENKGDQNSNGVPCDVVIIIDEKLHALYKRDGNDLVVNRKLSLADALAGTTVNLKTLDGRNLVVPLTEIVTPGYEIVVAGEGMPISKNPGGVKGNLKIKFDVKFPARLSQEQKTAIRRDLEG
jgi:DnaJ family protein B protein 4